MYKKSKKVIFWKNVDFSPFSLFSKKRKKEGQKTTFFFTPKWSILDPQKSRKIRFLPFLAKIWRSPSPYPATKKG